MVLSAQNFRTFTIAILDKVNSPHTIYWNRIVEFQFYVCLAM